MQGQTKQEGDLHDGDVERVRAGVPAWRVDVEKVERLGKGSGARTNRVDAGGTAGRAANVNGGDGGGVAPHAREVGRAAAAKTPPTRPGHLQRHSLPAPAQRCHLGPFVMMPAGRGDRTAAVPAAARLRPGGLDRSMCMLRVFHPLATLWGGGGMCG